MSRAREILSLFETFSKPFQYKNDWFVLFRNEHLGGPPAVYTYSKESKSPSNIPLGSYKDGKWWIYGTSYKKEIESLPAYKGLSKELDKQAKKLKTYPAKPQFILLFQWYHDCNLMQ